MKTIVVFVVLAFSCFTLHSQTLAKNDQLKLDADYYLMDKDFTKALNTYLNILKSEPENADIKYKVGICYLNSENDKKNAIPYLEEASKKISEKHNPNSFKETNAPVDVLFLLGSAYRMNNQLDEAMAAYTSYKNYLEPSDDYNLRVIDQYLRNCEMAKTMQMNPVNMQAVNLGKPVNSELANFNPVVSGDGKTILYNVPARIGYDIFTSTFKDTAWTTPKNITSTISSDKFMKVCDISNDGTKLLLVYDDPVNADICMSTLNKGRWSKAEPLGKEVNSKYNETHASFTADEKTLYFTSDRKGGQGDLDIFKSEMDSKGGWGKAVNLGPIINTPFNEATPFMAKTGEKLYFSSEGHDGMGGYDIFCYDFANPLKGVVNLGYPVNTTDNDLFYVPVGDGSSAYYAFKGDDSYGGRDIYQVSVSQRQTEPPVQEEVYAEIPAEVVPVDTIVPDTVFQVPENVDVVNQPIAETVIEQPVADTQPVYQEPAEVITPAEETVTPVEPPVAETVPVEEPEPVVTQPSEIQFGASYKVQIMALKKQMDFAHFNGISGISLIYSDNWFRYTIGNTTDRQQAENMLSDIITKGYKDAFIRTSSIVPKYTIQIMAVPGPVVDLNQFTNLSVISVTRGHDNFCRYSTGEYATKEEALNDLDRVKALGYKTAFVARLQ